MTHTQKLKRLESLMTEPLVCEFHALAAEIDAFERETYPIDPPTLADAVKFRREQAGLNQKQMAELCVIPVARYKALELGEDCGIKEARKLAAIGIPASVILRQNDQEHLHRHE